eukprot:gene11917-8720_t
MVLGLKRLGGAAMGMMKREKSSAEMVKEAEHMKIPHGDVEQGTPLPDKGKQGLWHGHNMKGFSRTKKGRFDADDGGDGSMGPGVSGGGDGQFSMGLNPFG